MTETMINAQRNDKTMLQSLGKVSQCQQSEQQSKPMHKAQQLMVWISRSRHTLTQILTLHDCVNLGTFHSLSSGDNDIMPPFLG